MQRLDIRGRGLAALLLPVALVASCGSMFQGPITGSVALSREMDAADALVRLSCSGPGIHGYVQTDREQVRVSAKGRFVILFSLQFPTTERCHLDVLHPRYRTARVELTDEFLQLLPVIELEDWSTYFGAGPPARKRIGSEPPWPQRDILRFSSDVILWLRGFPERERPEFVKYVPDLHALYRLAVQTASRRSAAMRRLTDAIGRFEEETGFAYPFRAFHGIVKAGDARRVREFIDGGMLLDVWDSHGGTALSVAAAEGHVDVVQTLLELAPDAQRTLANAGCNSPLLAAVGSQRWPVVLELLRVGADPNAQCRNQRRIGDAMGEFARRGEVAWLQRFLDVDVPVDTPGQRGTTALAEGAKVGRIESVKMLLAAGANPNVETDEGVSLLQDAIAKGYLDVERALRRAGADA